MSELSKFYKCHQCTGIYCVIMYRNSVVFFIRYIPLSNLTIIEFQIMVLSVFHQTCNVIPVVTEFQIMNVVFH